MWLLKRYGLPWLYWNVLLRGRTMPFLGEADGVDQQARRAEIASRA